MRGDIAKLRDIYISLSKEILSTLNKTTSLPILNEYEIDFIVKNKIAHYTINIYRIINEPFTEPMLELNNPFLIYGPPNVGKSWFAFRQALQWKSGKKNKALAFFLNSSIDSFNIIPKLVENIPSDFEILLVIDDIHFSRDNIDEWMSSLESTQNKFVFPLKIIWVSRDGSIISDLLSDLISPPIPYRFPVERVLLIYLERLKKYKEWQRIVAAFETGLDPNIASKIQGYKSTKKSEHFEDNIIDFIKFINEKKQKALRNNITSIKRLLQNEDIDSYKIYLKMLPLGSISYPIDTDFLKCIGDIPISSIYYLEQFGLIKIIDDKIHLNEHPFQIKEKLKSLEQWPEHSFILSEVQTRFDNIPKNITLSELMFSLYITIYNNKKNMSDTLETLGNYAEWSGVRQPFTMALKFISEHKFNIKSDRFFERINIWLRKLTRTTYPEDEEYFLSVLDQDKLKWIEDKKIAQKSANKKSGNIRLDTIYYEIGYVEYMYEHYNEAYNWFSKSVDTGFKIIETGMQSKIKSEQWQDGKNAISHIWISAILERSTLLRMYFNDAFDNNNYSELEERISNLIYEIKLIHLKLREANIGSSEESGKLYIEALQVIRPNWQFPQNSKPYKRQKEMNIFLGRHELNSWNHSLETAVWPVLFGFVNKKYEKLEINEVLNYDPTFPPPAPPTGLTEHRLQQVQLVYQWSENPDLKFLENQVISTGIMMKSGGGFEYLGDLILLAWRISSSQKVAETLEWYLLNKIPNIGFNGLSKKALKYINQKKCRILSL